MRAMGLPEPSFSDSICGSRTSRVCMPLELCLPGTKTVMQQHGQDSMNELSLAQPLDGAPLQPVAVRVAKAASVLTEHVIEVISDSGEGAQRCGQSLGGIAAKMGNGIWTVGMLPAGIPPPA